MIDSQVLNFIETNQLQNKTVIVGFSGGFDSMCLLYSLNKIKDVCGLRLVAVHYNHNWRGAIALKEQLHCEKVCEELGVEFYTETAPEDVPHNETVARELRYDFFERAKLKFKADVIFTAHNFNDNAETLIYRVAKGTGLTGLKGILKKRDCYYRPLLDVDRDEIENYCKQKNLLPNDDSSNKDTIHKRNLIRHEILPLLKEINPNVVEALNNLSRVAKSELDILDEYLVSVKARVFDEDKIITSEFAKLSDNLKQKLVYDFIYNSEVDYDYKLIENATKFLNSSIENKKIAKFSLTKDMFLYIDSNRIEIITQEIKTDTVVEVAKAGVYNFDENIIEISENSSSPSKNGDEKLVDVDLSNYKKVYLRTRRDGDVIQPLGFDGKMKLKKYLMSKKIPQYKRDKLVLLCDEHEVLWVAGVGMSEKIKVKTLSTHRLKLVES